MLQSLESKRSEQVRRTEDRILDLLEDEPLPVEELASLEGVCKGEVMSSVARLMAAGEVRLVVAEYLWGVEFSLERICL